MKVRSLWSATLVAALLPAGAAFADPALSDLTGIPAPSAFALPMMEDGPDGPTLALTTSDGYARSPESAERTRYEAVRYRPRSRRTYSDNGPQSPAISTVHAGFFDPSGGFGNGLVLGFRAGPQVDPHVQIGAGVDWWYKHEAQTQQVGGGEFPIGGTFEQQREISHFTANLLPIMAFVQVTGDDNMSVIPYGGAGVGYEALFLSGQGRDALDQPFDFDATYGGFGWQAWGGVMFPLSGRARVNAELFGNFSELSREVDDPTTGETIREIVDMNGIGGRLGITWGF
jgi:hypothetical protein